MRLRELFDTTATYNWSTQLPNDRFVAKFYIDGREYRWSAHWFSYGDEDELDGYEISFCYWDGKKCRTDDTGLGDERLIIGTVFTILKEFTHKIKIDRIVYSAEGHGRQSVYKLMMRRLLPNWQLVENSDDYFYYDKTSRKTQ